ncbi:hypothetical protein J2T16_004103 [Paenibacillus intestini]|nr:hypothetical protein [Paenibacillus intestini]
MFNPCVECGKKKPGWERHHSFQVQGLFVYKTEEIKRLN